MSWFSTNLAQIMPKFKIGDKVTFGNGKTVGDGKIYTILNGPRKTQREYYYCIGNDLRTYTPPGQTSKFYDSSRGFEYPWNQKFPSWIPEYALISI